ncbi:hypothetical protein QJS10_CPA08g00643 [Acorus calamus]|uniref:DDE Tnp4 domain-containing protein n=1 Tax=Acorus calamus TaxID=4465 RepID=A0AAV9E954_ACOCL|nr:hypothetical protein QJS10_CPA08g00643 [Acorus calamus]
MAVCDFNMRFTFLSAGWEGTTHDAKVLAHAVYNPRHNFPHGPQEKYYVVDAGYPNRRGFLALYRNTRYHLPDF